MNSIHPTMAKALAPFTAEMHPYPTAVAQALIKPKVIDTTHRPTDRQLLQALADAYQISAKKAHAWLYEIDFDALSDLLICEMREAA